MYAVGSGVLYILLTLKENVCRQIAVKEID
jgi:hypothetical protein